MVNSDISAVSTDDDAPLHSKQTYADRAFFTLNDGTQAVINQGMLTFCPYCDGPDNGPFNQRDLMLHARNISSNPLSNNKDAGMHDGFYRYLANCNPHIEARIRPQPVGQVYVNRVKYCWPLVGIMVGGVNDSTNRNNVLSWASRHGIPVGMIRTFQRKYRMSYLTMVHFTDYWSGRALLSAREFDRVWRVQRKGKKHWMRDGLKNNAPFEYGWLATEQDRNTDSELGQLLLENCQLRTIDQIMNTTERSMIDNEMGRESLMNRIQELEEELKIARGMAMNTANSQ